MHSTLNPKQTDPRDVLLVAPDVVLVAREDIELSNLAHDAMRYPSDPQTHMGSDFSAGLPVPPVDRTFRPAAVNDVQVPGDRRLLGRRVVRAFAGFLLAACIGGARVAWQSYGDAAKQIIARWALAQTAPEGVAPTSAALSPKSAQLLQSMARDLARAGQEIEQLKASIEQLKASQQQMSRDVAKASEQNLRPRISAPPPRSAAAPARKPMPPFPPPQAAAAPTLPQAAAPSVQRHPEPQPQDTAQPQAEPQLSSVPRPPIPVR